MQGSRRIGADAIVWPRGRKGGAAKAQGGPGCLQHSDQCHPEFEVIHPADFLVMGGGGCCATGMAKPQEVTAPTQFSQQNTVTSCCCADLFASKRATQSLRSTGATLRSDNQTTDDSLVDVGTCGQGSGSGGVGRPAPNA